MHFVYEHVTRVTDNRVATDRSGNGQENNFFEVREVHSDSVKKWDFEEKSGISEIKTLVIWSWNSYVCGKHGKVSVVRIIQCQENKWKEKIYELFYTTKEHERYMCVFVNPGSTVMICVPHMLMTPDSICFPCSWGWSALWHRIWNGWNQWWLLWYRPRYGDWRQRHSQLRCPRRSKFCDRGNACAGSLESKTGKSLYFMHPLLALLLIVFFFLWCDVEVVLFTFLLQFVWYKGQVLSLVPINYPICVVNLRAFWTWLTRWSKIVLEWFSTDYHKSRNQTNYSSIRLLSASQIVVKLKLKWLPEYFQH